MALRNRSSLWRIIAALLIIGILTGLSRLAFHAIVEFVRIDDCLDAGGSYNYDTGKCLHPSRPDP